MLSNDTSSDNGKFISVVAGKWTIRVPEGTEGSVSRVNKNNQTVNELHYSMLTGSIVDMKYKDTPFGRVAEIEMVDGRDSYLVSFTTTDQHLMTLAKILPNVERSEPVELLLMLDKEKSGKKGKDCFALLVKQNGEWVKHFYKRGVEGFPEAVERRDGSLNYSDQEDFLLGVVEEFFLQPFVAPFVEAVEDDRVPDGVTDAGESLVPADDSNDSDEIPF